MPSMPPTARIQRKAVVFENRGNAQERGYDVHWQHVRARWLKAHPLCTVCLTNNKTKAATVVDHIVPHRGNRELFYDETNLQSLCTRCHNQKTGKGQ